MTHNVCNYILFRCNCNANVKPLIKFRGICALKENGTQKKTTANFFWIYFSRKHKNPVKMERIMNNNEIKERLRIIIKDYGGNASQLARDINMTPNVLTTILSNEKKGVTVSLLFGIASLGYSVNWLLRGEGDMIQVKILEKDLIYLQHQVQILSDLIKK